MMGKIERKQQEMEGRLDQLLAEKLELEYQCRELKSNYAHEKGQREEILKLHENTRRLKHDMKNHIMVITSYLQENALDEAKEYLSHVLDELNGIYTYVETGNSVMNYVLNQKLEKACQKGLLVKAEIENLAFACMESVDFVSLLSNLLDNAIEGAVQTETQSKPEISVSLTARRCYETILVKNSIAESVLEKNPHLLSGKEGDGHGYGVGQIRRIVDKYDGLCQFYEEENMFCAVAMIPAVPPET